MDLVASCEEKLSYFRIKELKDVLTQIGLPKQGKKQDLMHRILSMLSDEQVRKVPPKQNVVGKEEVAKLIDDIYRSFSGATDLASKVQDSPDCSNLDITREFDDPFCATDIKVRCPCGSSLQTDSMIKCEDRKCVVWQHIGCVIIPQEAIEGNLPVPDVFYCELCRLSRADPFLVSNSHPLYPVKMITINIPTDGTNPVQSVEKAFQLTRADRELLMKQEYDVQAWCMLLNDKVLFRMQWPQYADLQVNGIPVRAINRPGSQLLGSNGRDDGPIITPCTKDGTNKISLTGCDARIFCFGVRIVKRRTVQQIFNLIPEESKGERFEDALARVCRCIGGGATAGADSDSDLEVVADSFGVNLRCPMSGSRIQVAGRFKPCAHMGCFDLDVFVQMNQRSRKWQCPICMQNYSLENLIVDPYFNRVASMMKTCGEDVTDIEVKSDGSWRVKAKNESERNSLGSLCNWHFPDGTLCKTTHEDEPEAGAMNEIKWVNNTGFSGVMKADDMNKSSGNGLREIFGDVEPKIIAMSSSSISGNSWDGEGHCVDQDGGRNFNFSTINGIELDSMPSNMVSAYGHLEQNPSAGSEVIVLSDSDEDNDILVSSVPGHTVNRTEPGEISFTVPHPAIADSYEDRAFGTSTGSGYDLPNNDIDEFGGVPTWSLPSGSQDGTGFQLFCSENDVSNSLFELQHDCADDFPPSTTNGYTPESQAVVEAATLVPQAASVGHLDDDMNYGLVHNPLANGRDDPSLQLFVPIRPSGPSTELDMGEQRETSDGMRSGDWISLRLGECAPANGGGTTQQLASKEDTTTGSQLPGIEDNRRLEKAVRETPGSPFSFPRQKRSVRPRCTPDSGPH
ncbi:E3 SUMO-protein ligase SIZ1-like isoform X3 [Punica granatum]|uniref:E3 SUMO-protein ligase SIZ1-like isoform X3 n=1 Tax=Punica granatum TaxID=22663 RepID=A0A6P8DU02_PUNGR|nr:E3 SUMO-protein ligase SIZ1-like isoform X3 [Punica granatum]